MTDATANNNHSGPHTKDHLDSIMADHYKPEDVDLHLQ